MSTTTSMTEAQKQERIQTLKETRAAMAKELEELTGEAPQDPKPKPKPEKPYSEMSLTEKAEYLGTKYGDTAA